MRSTAEDALTPSAAPTATRLGRPGVKFGAALRWSYVVTTGGNLVLALLTFVVAAILNPHDFGVFTLGMVWVALALVLLQHGPTLAVIQHHDITDEHVNASFWATTGGAILYAGLIAATAPLWAAVNHLPELTRVTLALTPVIVLNALNVIPDAVLRRRLQMRGLAIRVVLANLGGGLAAIGCAYAGLGVWALVVQQLVWPTLYAAMLWPIAGWRPRLGPIWRPLRDLRRTSVQTYVGAVGGYLASRIDVVLMGAFFGPVVIGLHRFAVRLAEMANELSSGGLRLVSLPHLSRHSEDTPALDRELSRIMRATAMLAFPALGIVAGVTQPLMLFIGDQWALAAQPLRLLCVVAAVHTITVILGAALQARQRPEIPALFTWITMALAACGILLAANISADRDTLGKLLAVAWAMLAVETVTAGALGYVMFARVLRVSAWPTAVGALPGSASAVAAALGGTVVYRLIDPSLGRFVDLALSGTAATVAAGVVLALDGQARRHAADVLGRLRRTGG